MGILYMTTCGKHTAKKSGVYIAQIYYKTYYTCPHGLGWLEVLFHTRLGRVLFHNGIIFACDMDWKWVHYHKFKLKFPWRHVFVRVCVLSLFDLCISYHSPGELLQIYAVTSSQVVYFIKLFTKLWLFYHMFIVVLNSPQAKSITNGQSCMFWRNISDVIHHIHHHCYVCLRHRGSKTTNDLPSSTRWMKGNNTWGKGRRDSMRYWFTKCCEIT